MTKKPSEKNKAWEKDRRDRLNKTFDELAKLLPKHDASVVWSKIEIIQKAITFITDLQKKQEDFLKTNDPELLNEYEEFVNCLKFYQERNAQLTELLKKAKVSLPPVVLPQLLVDKPELLPKADEAETVCLQKPKRQRNRTKKNDAGAKKLEENEEKKEEGSNTAAKVNEVISDKDRNSPLKCSGVALVEAVAKPTAIITAFTRESLTEAQTIVQHPASQPTPLVPEKSLVLHLLRPKSKQKIQLIPRPMLRKCYPRQNSMLRLSADIISHRKLLRKQRKVPKKKLPRKEKPGKRLKLQITPEPIREQSVSPTAAFLLSFPVVTSSMLSGKNVENAENSVSLENLNNFFTTEEYSKFCDQNPVAEEKVPTPICIPVPVDSAEKPLINGKPMTSFTVSAITRPSSPKKPIANCEQVISKRINEAPWIVENKLIRITPTTSFESCNNFENMKPMIGSTSMCRTALNSTSQQVTSGQYSSTNTVTVACYTSPVTELRTSAKLEPANIVPSPRKPNSTGHFFPRYIQSTSPTIAVSNTLKTTAEPTPKAHGIVHSSQPKQKESVHANIPMGTWKIAKSMVSSEKAIPIQGSSQISSIGCKSSTSFNPKVPTDNTSTDVMPKTPSKPSVSTFYSPTKSFFYDFPTQSQPITTFNLNLTPTTSSSTADPLISSTTATKSHSFLGFPSIKTEFPWLPPSTASFTIPLTPTTTTTTSATCNLSSNFTPFDLSSIVSESLTSTSFAFSLTTPKSSEPTIVEAGNKQNTGNKCNQMNLFLPYDEQQYTPTFTFSLTKPTDSQVYPTAREIPWKAEKAKDISDQIFYDCEQSKPQQKPHVNWMTTPSSDYTPPLAAPPLPAIDFGNQFPASTNFDFGFGCRKDSYDDENQFINWSPTKPLGTDFSTAYNFENFGSNEAPPNKTVKQIFSVSQLVDQTPSQETSAMKKTLTKPPSQKSTPVKHTFSNIYSAESLIAKKDNHRMTNSTNFYNTDASNTQTDYHNTSNYFYNYPNTQSCLQTENDYLGASTYSAPSSIKTTSILPPTGGTVTTPVIPPFDSVTASSTTNYFAHSISSNTNDPYDPTYFPSSNYNHPTTTNWNHVTTKGTPVNNYNQSLVPLAGYGAVEPSCQQNSNVSGNLTNFNLSSICPEIDGKDSPSGW